MGLDSTEIVLKFEKTFGIIVPYQAAEKIVTVGDLQWPSPLPAASTRTWACDSYLWPVGAARAVNNDWRLQSLEKIKQLMHNHPEIRVFSFHDPAEWLS